MIDPKKELFRWGPIDGKPIYTDPFVQAFVHFPDYIGVPWPDVIGYFKNDKMLFIADYSDLRKNGRKLFLKYVLNESRCRKEYKEWAKTAQRLTGFEKIANKGLSKIPSTKLTDLFVSWDFAVRDFWEKGFLPELANWGGEQLLKSKILEFNKLSFIEIFEAISAPETLSFFQKEELELLKIRLMKGRKEELKRHQRKYYWLRNNYAHTGVLGETYFKKELNKISAVQAERKIREIEAYAKKVRQKKADIAGKYRISREIMDIAHKLAYCVWWQDYRKQFIFIANHITARFLEEISRRKIMAFGGLCYCTLNEIIALLVENKRINTKERRNGFVCYYPEKGKIDYFVGEEASKFVKPYLEINISRRELKGVVVSTGKHQKVKGVVRIILSPKSANTMEKGAILVAPMTSPDFIIAMRKAAAIITDEGGMTSHAAIISRELNIPCIVGTKIATKILKDGQLIEVDASRGLVKIIK